MTCMPPAAAIQAAEWRVAQRRTATYESLHRAQEALNARLARPSTLAIAAGAAALLGFGLARRMRDTRNRNTHLDQGVAVAKTASAAGIAVFLIRNGLQLVPYVLQRLDASRKQRAPLAATANNQL